MKVALIDYGAGNLRSAAKAIEAVGGNVYLLSDATALSQAERIVLPGVGAFADCMAGLQRLPGMIEALNEMVLKKGRPFLGICVGMQLMAREGREFGTHPGLGWLAGKIVRLEPGRGKVPHMGWNEVSQITPHPLIEREPQAYYFVHSFHMMMEEPQWKLAVTDYGGTMNAIVGKDNMIGTQFHPEKSGAAGLRLLERFLHWFP